MAYTSLAQTNIFPVRHLRYLIPLLLILIVQACGFQLRGALEISQNVSPLYLKQNSAFSLGRDIKQLLVSNKIEVTENINQANSQLTLISEKKESRVLSVDTNGRVREYLLIYAVDYSIQFKKVGAGQANDKSPGSELASTESPGVEQPRVELASEEMVTAKQTNVEQSGNQQNNHQQSTATNEFISVKRTLLFNEDAVLAVANESEILYKDMRRDVARLILLKVQARSKEAEITAQ